MPLWRDIFLYVSDFIAFNSNFTVTYHYPLMFPHRPPIEISGGKPSELWIFSDPST